MGRNRWIWLLVLFTFRLELFSQTEVMFSRQGGFYDEPFVLSLGSSDWECQIHYTTNGAMPTALSPRYETPLFLDESLYSSSDIYTLPISPLFEPFVPDSVQHAIVIRAAAFDEEGSRISDVVTQTYLIRSLGCEHHGLAVVSVCADSLALFDADTGILVPGALFDPANPDLTGNYFQRGREWERWANVEFYEPDDNSGINQQCGLRTHGNRARKAPAKGLKIYAREEYGKKRFKHRFFETTQIKSFNHLVLKPFSTLWPCSGVQDYVANRMALQMGLEAPNSRPVAVYLNGEYWGIYFLQEKMDDHYLEDHFGIEPEQCNIICGNGINGFTGEWDVEVESGEGFGFDQMMDWLEDADLSDSTNYAYISNLVDIDNFIDYQILETFIANTDWPANNSRCWQADGSKWRFAFFDGDATMLEKEYDVFANATYVADNQWHTGGKSTLLFRRLLENNDFKIRFSYRVNEWCNSVLQEYSTTDVLDGIVQDLRLEMPSQIARFGYPDNMDYWNWGCSLSHDFLVNRVTDYQKACDSFESLKEHDYQSNTDDFVIYPNPTEDVVHIRMLDGRSRATGFVLCDAMGRVILGGKSYLSACQEIVLGEDLRSGVYVVKIGPYVHRFVKY
jgi:hypothetical protein